MNAQTASPRTGSATSPQGTPCAGFFRKVNNPAGLKRHFLLSRTPNHLPFPIEGQRLLGKALPLADRPRFAIDLHVIRALAHQMAAQIPSVDMEFFDLHAL